LLAALDDIAKDLPQRMDTYAQSMSHSTWRIADMETQKQHRIESLQKAQKMVADAGKRCAAKQEGDARLITA
jgi:hypothetical protein